MQESKVLKRVYFVRHGESEGNAKKVYVAGESKLTQNGIVQAESVAERFQHIDVDVILVSDMERARHSAEKIQEKAHAKNIVTSSLLRERKLPSETVGMSYDEPIRTSIHREMIAHSHDPDWHHSDEENFFDLRLRAVKALEMIDEREEKNLLVVSHGVFICMIIGVMVDRNFSHLLFLPMIRFMVLSNTGLTICEKREGVPGTPWRLITWNDIAHLGE